MSAIGARKPLTWHLFGRDLTDLAISSPIDERITADWAWAGASGAGVRVCIIDSGIEEGHPLVGPVQACYAVAGEFVEECEAGDTFGHGTACASIIRRIAPGCGLTSVRVLGGKGTGMGNALLAGVRWSVRQRFDVVNLSLSTTRPQFDRELRELADEAHFQGTALVASAHNSPVESFPWRYSSVISVGSHAEPDPGLVIAHTQPPVDFFAPGRAVTVAGPGGGTTRNTGNSFATPHVAGRCALILGKHPHLTVAQLKTILFLTSDNVRGAP
jgi:subtilisin family serine protease